MITAPIELSWFAGREQAGGRSIAKGHLWCFTGTGPLVAYAFTKTWEAQEVAPWLASIEGCIQCDDYKGYSSSANWRGGGANASWSRQNVDSAV